MEAARLAGCSRDTIVRARRSGRFPNARLDNGRWMIPFDDLVVAGLYQPPEQTDGPATGPQSAIPVGSAEPSCRRAGPGRGPDRRPGRGRRPPRRRAAIPPPHHRDLGQARGRLMGRPLTGSLRSYQGLWWVSVPEARGSSRRRHESFVAEVRRPILARAGRRRRPPGIAAARPEPLPHQDAHLAQSPGTTRAAPYPARHRVGRPRLDERRLRRPAARWAGTGRAGPAHRRGVPGPVVRAPHDHHHRRLLSHGTRMAPAPRRPRPARRHRQVARLVAPDEQ